MPRGLLAVSISLVEECLSFSKLVSGGFLNYTIKVIFARSLSMVLSRIYPPPKNMSIRKSLAARVAIG